MEAYFKESDYCDFSHPDIRELVQKISRHHQNDRDKAVAMFCWVRDNILYRVGLWNRKASETLREREGTCTNKANLLVAMLRSAKIPAGYGLLKVDGQKYWGPATPDIISKHVGKVSNHIFAVVHLDRWICVDPSDDARLCKNIGYITQTAALLEWDGVNHARIPLDKNHVFTNEYPIPDIDHIIRKKPKNVKGIRLSICNVLIKFLRETRIEFKETSEVETAFLAFLSMHHPIYYRALFAASVYKDFKLTIAGFKTKYFRKPLPATTEDLKVAS